MFVLSTVTIVEVRPKQRQDEGDERRVYEEEGA